jgi:hypothetical protein
LHSPTVLENSRTRFASARSEESSGGRPAQLEERGRGDSQFPLSRGSTLGPVVEGPVDDEGE